MTHVNNRKPNGPVRRSAEGARKDQDNRLVAPHKGAALHVGSRGAEVRKVERELKERGVLKGPVDGFYDARTKAAVQKVERSQGWKDDGIVGRRLWNLLTEQRTDGDVGGDGGSQVGGGAGPSGVNVPREHRNQTFKTVNINVMSNPEMPQAKVVHDVRKASKAGDLIGWNEIGPARYAQAIKDLGPDWGHYFPRDGKIRIPNPISWKKEEWKALDGGFERTHNGLAKTSPHRYITWVKLKHRATNQNIVRINTHLVSGAWNSKDKLNKEWRKEKWDIHMEKLEKMVERFEKQGLKVVIGGDFNRDSYRVLGNQVAYDSGLHVGTHGKSTLDYVMHDRNKEISKVGSHVERDYRSDHNAVVVKYKLKDESK